LLKLETQERNLLIQGVNLRTQGLAVCFDLLVLGIHQQGRALGVKVGDAFVVQGQLGGAGIPVQQAAGGVGQAVRVGDGTGVQRLAAGGREDGIEHIQHGAVVQHVNGGQRLADDRLQQPAIAVGVDILDDTLDELLDVAEECIGLVDGHLAADVGKVGVGLVVAGAVNQLVILLVQLIRAEFLILCHGGLLLSKQAGMLVKWQLSADGERRKLFVIVVGV